MADESHSGIFVFSGARGALIGLVLRNLLLTVLTLGLYHFWARTNIRAFFWRHISLGGERFDYVGRGAELLWGWLIMGVLAMAVVFGEQFWELWTGMQDFPPWVQFLLWCFYTAIPVMILAFVAFSRFLSWRYLATRTLWRAVRFHTGERAAGVIWKYIAISLVLLLANLTTLGLTYPYWRAWKIGFLINHSFFGSLAARFVGYPDHLMRFWWPVWLCIASIVFCAFVVFYFSFLMMPIVILMLLASAGAFYFFARYKGEEIKFFLNHVRTAESEIRLICDFDSQTFAGLLLGNAALVVIVSLLTGPLILITLPLLWKPLVVLPVFVHVCDHLRLEGYERLDDVLASGEMSSFVGEGLAGGLDADFGF